MEIFGVNKHIFMTLAEITVLPGRNSYHEIYPMKYSIQIIETVDGGKFEAKFMAL